ncbi:MAG: hypothetical protein KKF62_09770 [Bacteroidetes bacterium]|nr:hypothetical protein [Bacteroidota bacterium]MBU1115627.1 hypothetical protein [Bacteroidota bacterium]MBU1797601.1 hypothetical protein [Bacteroidota bacterium]
MIIQNELTINYAAEIYKLFTDELEKDADLKITLESPTPIDVTFVQILHSFLAKCKSINKKVSFEIKEQNEFVKALKQIGYCDATKVLEIVGEQNGEDNA